MFVNCELWNINQNDERSFLFVVHFIPVCQICQLNISYILRAQEHFAARKMAN